MPRQRQPEKRIRVRSKSLAEVDETKLALAFWLMAKRQLEEQESVEDSAP
ncbi:MAG TPA: hypothetical protein VFH99_03090 [Candidatus Saccharimonadales bacterium]|nr:hypothetical protein [Candidatus Saccharimonadales bacterium]